MAFYYKLFAVKLNSFLVYSDISNRKLNTDKQTDRQVGGQADRRTYGQSHERADRRLGGHKDRRTDGENDKRIDGQAVKRTVVDGHMNKQPDGRTQ